MFFQELLIFKKSLARSGVATSFHILKAADAVSIASSISDNKVSGTSAIVSCVAGFSTGKYSVVLLSVKAPFINILIFLTL